MPWSHSHLDDLDRQLQAIEAQSPDSTLVIYRPDQEHEPFYASLCQTYLDASPRQRARICDAVSDKKGVLNRLLGFVYKSSEHLRATQDGHWLRIGLAAAAIQGGRLDERDFLLALAELWMAAEAAGIDPRPEFEAAGGGVPPDFHTYAVLKSRRGN